jgi:hypothetical protein|tara:strand:- start:874 stop:1059 length:186 start_codon:yes stop_codon:yes gene_type:complete
MKDYKTTRYICNECNWEWETLSANPEEEVIEECPSCGSFSTREAVISPEISFIDKDFYSEN